MRAKVEWTGASGTLRTDQIGEVATSGLQGRVFSAKGIVPPAGATNAIVFIEGTANFTATTVAKLFADAVAVTIP